MTVTYLEFSSQNLVFSDEEKCMAVLYWTPLFLVCFRKLTVLQEHDGGKKALWDYLKLASPIRR